MPVKLRSLSGSEVVRTLAKFGFEVSGQRGSHVKLSRRAPDGAKQTIHIPLHREIRRGTLHAIFRQACEYVTEDELRPYFYAE